MRHQQISTQTYKIITQYGDMLVVKQGVHRHNSGGTNTNHHHHHHHSSSSSTGGTHQKNQHSHHHHHHHHHHHGSTSSGTGGGGGSEQGTPASQPSRPILMTFHDLGMNSELQFATFCECDEVKLMLQTFTIIHVNFIGQEFTSSGSCCGSLPNDFKYPTVEQMAECIVDVCAQLRVRSFIALAVGAGAHIVSTLALMRPDLVHGLFLINPVISSCSITEWLYFKMSAIASNHQILGTNSAGHHQHHPVGVPGSSSFSSSASVNSSEDHQHAAGSNPEERASSAVPACSSSAPAASGFKKLWKAVNHQQQHHGRTHHSSLRSGGGSSATSSVRGHHDEVAEASESPDAAPPPPQAQKSAGTGSGPAASSRLRQLILSRNFRLGHKHAAAQRSGADFESSAAQQKPTTGGEPSDPGRRQSASSPCGEAQPAGQTRKGSCGSQASSASSLAGSTGDGKRPPLEYLMYHHFGTATLQRFRRMSSDLHSGGSGGGGGGEPLATADEATATDSGQEELRSELERQASGDRQLEQLPHRQQEHRASCDSTASSQSQRAPGEQRRHHPHQHQQQRGSRGSRGSRADSDSRRSQDSLARGGTSSSSTAAAGRPRTAQGRAQRSHSICLSASYLASFSSERQRAAYMQNVYRQYFGQLNAHNLWLFAQSFVKRKTLNLRKDCGAAAHAAAAAAALGTSICAAFVGAGGPVGEGPPGAPHPLGAAQAADRPAAAAPPAAAEKSAKSSTATSNKQEQHQQQKALVAGTKVKRTFTCQTLIMCSSVRIHRERALKLMSLLNPLQATWIKTDQLLVLEEKPEKVCQALRLFLQGIGYSMSTYERRLRLSSAQASISSADSNGSARSLNLDSFSLRDQQQQQPQQASHQKSSSTASASSLVQQQQQQSQMHQKMST